MGPPHRHDLLTAIDRPSPVKVELLTGREKGARIVRRGIALSGLESKQISDKDHGQFSRECDGKEKLSFHEMVSSWPPEVMREIAALVLLECGGTDVSMATTITIRRIR